jgi:hypothetical protein
MTPLLCGSAFRAARGLAALIRERFPRPVLVGAVALVAGANTFNIGADIGSMAASLQLVAPVPYAPTVVAFAAGIVALEILVPYHRYAAILRSLTLSLAAYVGVFSGRRARRWRKRKTSGSLRRSRRPISVPSEQTSSRAWGLQSASCSRSWSPPPPPSGPKE